MLSFQKNIKEKERNESILVSHIIHFPPADAIAAEDFENIVAKGEIAHDEQFLL